MTDSQLIRSYLAGDASAFGAIVDRHGTAVYAFLVYLTGDRDLADDLFQETFLKASAGLRDYAERQKLRSWLVKIAHRATLDELKRVRRRSSRVVVDDRAVTAAEDPSQSPDRAFEAHEEAERVRAAVTVLPVRQRTVFLLRQQGDLTFREIADQTGQPLGTVISQMGYAVKHLQRQLRTDTTDAEAPKDGRRP